MRKIDPSTLIGIVWIALSLFAIGNSGCGDPGQQSDVGQAIPQELTQAQCSYFAVNDKITICHRTSSTKNPFTIIMTNVASCGGHSTHPGDYVAFDDPTCNGQGCFPEGAPFDGTVECCEGLTNVSGFCRPLCPDLDDNNACTTDTCGPTGSVHTPVDVDDGRACTVDSCDPATGDVTHDESGCV